MARWGRAFPARPIYSHGPLVEEAPPGCTPELRAAPTVVLASSGTDPVVAVTGGSPVVGDVVLFFHGNDFYTEALMGTPTVTGTPTLHHFATADAGTNHAHVKAYWYEVNTNGAQTISIDHVAPAGDEEKSLVVYVFDGATIDSTNPIDDFDTAFSATAVATHVLPALQPVTDNDLMLAHDNAGEGTFTASYTWPGSMTERYDANDATFYSHTGATEVLGAAGDTGTRTVTPVTSVQWAGIIVAVRGVCVEEEATPPPAKVIEVPPRPRQTPVTIASHGPIPEAVAEVVTPPPPEVVKVPPRPRLTPEPIASHGPAPTEAAPQPAGTSFAGALAQGTATKIATTTAGRSVAGALARGVDIKIASPVGRCVGGALARSTAVKVAIPAGRSVAGALARSSATKIATTTAGRSVAGALARGSATKISTATAGRSVAGALARGISSKLASTSGFAYAGALTYGSTTEVPSHSGSSVAGASAQGTAAKIAIPSGRAVAGASAQGSAIQPRQVSGVCAAGVSAYGVAVQGGDVVMDTQVLPLAQALRDCLCAWASVNPNPPQNCCFRVGTIAHDADLHTDLCCEGIAYVSIGDIWPSNVFPDEDSTQASKVCSPPSWGVELRAGIVRCAPTGTDTEMPSCEDWALAHIQAANDAQALRKTACCIRAWVQTNNPGMSVVIQRQVQTDPLGGCMERYFTVALQIPNCDC